MSSRVEMPNIGALLAPILPALPAAAVSKQPAIGVLPLLSPILRQRVQLLGLNSTEPWLRLLSYDAAKTARLSEVVQSGRLEPHQVSGEVEVDWEYDAKTKYRRLDRETLNAFVVLEELELAFKLVYCVGDQDGGGDGWRVGEVTVAEKPNPFADFAGHSTIAEADKAFEEGKAAPAAASVTPGFSGTPDIDEGNDDYWNQYNETPARSPAPQRSPAPLAPQPSSHLGMFRTDSTEDSYYAQYDDVQPAMDNHDPDEEPLAQSQQQPEVSPPARMLVQPQAEKPASPGPDLEAERRAAQVLHPRPASSASSNGSRTVERFEEMAGRQEASGFAIKQHVSKSIRSLWQLSQASGIDREDFERLVQNELDLAHMTQDS
ncbi:hypothetical protein HYQ45_003498 [Verticillium longisporum]|uniref:Uncharacterized protein n=1 Tax=Verticillium longisporum TaxID=100787 RepID=A0A8I3AV31_VERLO|nr:hypothetical protein HYQ45_003498 [Verticillium longisporum]